MAEIAFKPWNGEVQPVPIDQIKIRDGKRYVIESDVGNVVKQLKAIDSHLCVRANNENTYVVYWRPDGCPECNRAGYGRQGWEEGAGDLILTAQELDQRIVNRIHEIDSHRRRGYRLADELERLDKETEKAQDRKFAEQIGEYGEQLAHALRKDLGIQRDSSRKHGAILPRSS